MPGFIYKFIMMVMCIVLCEPAYKDDAETIVCILVAIAVVCLAETFDKKWVTHILAAGMVFAAASIRLELPAFLPSMTYIITKACIYNEDSPLKLKGFVNAGIMLPVLYAALSGVIMHSSGLHITVTILSLVMAVSFGFLDFQRSFLIRELEHKTDEAREMEFLIAQHKEDSAKQQDAEVREATLKERNRIAREIHDNVGHSLSRALLMVGAISAVNRDENLTEPLGQLKDTLSEAMTNVRQSVHDLHDESIDLEKSLKLIVSEFSFCPVKLDLDIGQSMDKNLKYCIVSLVKEALSNTSKHSNANEASVTIRTHEKLYQLIIEDNGTVSINSDGKGIGLDNMRDRVNALGGTIYFTNERGFRIFATFPKNR